VLVVDDAVVVRRMLTDVLSAEPDFEVSVAANGKIALQKIAQGLPDVVTLDVEMPEMDGLETLRNIRKTWPKLPVIMFSTLTERGAAATFDALALGASDYVTKPANVGSVTAAIAKIREELVPKVRALSGASPPGGAPAITPGASPATPAAPGTATSASAAPGTSGPAGAAGAEGGGKLSTLTWASAALASGGARPGQTFATTSTTAAARIGAERPAVVAIGVSTGGPNALAAVLPALPGDLPVPVVIVQHMPPMFTRLLAERLNAQSKLTVVEGQAGMVLQAGTVYIAPGDFHMEVQASGTSVLVRLVQTPPENSCRPAVDVLFRSVARTYGPRVLGIVLTGMGQDGLRGCETIHEAGGRVVVQDEATSIVWGMPGFVARAGLAEKVLPLETIAAEIVRRAGAPQPGAAPGATSGARVHS
jgi:two-component system chemotaxis response regulator CheB